MDAGRGRNGAPEVSLPHQVVITEAASSGLLLTSSSLWLATGLSFVNPDQWIELFNFNIDTVMDSQYSERALLWTNWLHPKLGNLSTSAKNFNGGGSLLRKRKLPVNRQWFSGKAFQFQVDTSCLQAHLFGASSAYLLRIHDSIDVKIEELYRPATVAGSHLVRLEPGPVLRCQISDYWNIWMTLLLLRLRHRAAPHQWRDYKTLPIM